jgi:hypothetical protein
MNLIGIDISIDSTGMSILREGEIIISNFTVQKRNAGWIKKTMDVIDYEFINYTYKDIDNYTESEIMKLREFDHVTDLIFNKIIGNINKREKTMIAIEGYNYSRIKNTNSIIDIVSFSTLLRIKLLSLSKLEKLIIISPATVKSKACEMAYGYTMTKSGKKIINKNINGLAGGNFDKKDMLISLYEMNINNKLTTILNKYKEDLLKLKNVPKPIDDLIDSFFLMNILKI